MQIVNRMSGDIFMNVLQIAQSYLPGFTDAECD